MLEAVALLAASLALLVTRRRPTTVHVMPTTFVLPPVDAPQPPRRLARGSIAQPVTPLPEDELPRRRPVIRPTHARR